MTKQVAVVTGGASGIGRETCRRLSEDGFLLAVLDLDATDAQGSTGHEGLVLSADVSNPEAVEYAFRTIVDALGRIDVLVNNAGITGSPEATTCHLTPVEEWDRVHAVNTRGPFLCTRAALPLMMEQGSGHVITVASVAGVVAFPGRCAYTSSKGAALMLTRSIAVDYARHGIRANAVCPGFVQTPMTQWRLDDPQLREAVEARIPLGRVAQADDIADAISVLASGRMGYMTGHALMIDAGWTAL
jgi:NAD(P)-dependent dehydrogenase (short-subunit alcohol dehydrogenase family)